MPKPLIETLQGIKFQPINLDGYIQMTPADIRSVRNKLCLSQTEMAQQLGVTVDAYRHWEAGRRKPNGSAVRLLELLRDKIIIP